MSNSSSSTDPRWPKLLSLTVHEIRTPLTVVAGYIRMLLKEGAGPISDEQRRLLEKAEQSCGRLSSLLAEGSELSALEDGAAAFNRAPLDVRAVLGESVETLPDLPDRSVQIDLTMPGEPMMILGDAARLRQALSAVIDTLRHELVTSDCLLVHAAPTHDGKAGVRINIGDETRLGRIQSSRPEDLATFDEWRGGSGLGLAIARRVIEAHGGRIWSLRDDSRAAAAIELPTGS